MWDETCGRRAFATCAWDGGGKGDRDGYGYGKVGDGGGGEVGEVDRDGCWYADGEADGGCWAGEGEDWEDRSREEREEMHDPRRWLLTLNYSNDDGPIAHML